ncbi:MAG: YHS domain-containing protein [Candidatus Omnitrophica bacterium]|nr:YHS domain-containing protein [Candidatus Omnitrophota bacterium]
MKRLNRVWLSIGLLGLLAAATNAESVPGAPMSTGRVEDRRLVCMIDDNLQKTPGLEYAYQGKTYYLCCAGCLKRFASDPERFSHTMDPVSGQPVDKAQALIYSYDGHAYFFANEAHLGAFAKEPAQFLQQAQPSSGDEAPVQHRH